MKTPEEIVGRPAWVAKAALVLGGVILLAYANSFQAALTLDNSLIIGKDPRLWLPWCEAWPKIVNLGYWWPTAPSDLYRPLTTLSYRFNYLVFGNALRPCGYHWVNFFLHWANAGFVLWLALRLGRTRRTAALAAGVFALHPVAVESVTNIVGRADLLAAFSILAGLHCHLSAAREEQPARRLGWRLGLAAAAAIGVFCKESGVMLLGAVFLYDGLYLPRRPEESGPAEGRLPGIGRLWRSAVPFLPMIAAFAFARWKAVADVPIGWQIFVDNPLARAGLAQRLLTAAKVQGEYLRLLVWPARLSCDYSYDQVPIYGTAGFWPDAAAWLSLVLVAAIGIALWRMRKRWTDVAFGGLLYFGMMLPTANVLKVIGSIMAERFLYLPLIGFALVAGIGLDQAARAIEARLDRKKHPAWLALAPALLILLSLGWRVRARNRDWRDNLSLWTSAVAAAPDSFKTHKGLGSALAEADRSEHGLDAGIAEAEKSLAILNRPEIDRYPERRDTTLFITLGKLYCLKAAACAARHDQAAALLYAKKGTELLDRALLVLTWVNQELRRIGLVDGRNPAKIPSAANLDLYRTLASALHAIGRDADATNLAELAVRCDPFDVEGREFIATCLLALNRPQEAAVYAHMALLLDPEYPPAWADLDRIYGQAYAGKNPVRNLGGGSFAIDVQNPGVQRGVAAAAVGLDLFFRRAGLPEAAERIRAAAITRFRCPPAVFAAAARIVAAPPGT